MTDLILDAIHKVQDLPTRPDTPVEMSQRTFERLRAEWLQYQHPMAKAPVSSLMGYRITINEEIEYGWLRFGANMIDMRKPERIAP